MKLRNKIYLLLAGVLLVAMGVSGLFLHRIVETNLRQSVSNSVDAIARNSATTVDAFLESSRHDVRAIAMTLPAGALKAGRLQPVEQHLQRMQENFPVFRNGLFILDDHGRLLADWPPHPELRGADFSYRPYFQRTEKSGRGVIGQPYRSTRTGEPVLTFTAYLEDDRGSFLGVLGCSAQLFDPQGLGALRERRIGEHGYLYLFDHDRTLLLHPDAQRILRQDVPVGSNPLFDRAIAGFEGVEQTVNSRGVEMITAMRRIPGTTWVLAAQQPVAEALAAARSFEREMHFITLVIALATALLGACLVRSLMLPLTRLEQAVAALELPGDDENLDPETAACGESLAKLGGLEGHSEFGRLAGIIRQLYLRLSEALLESRKVSSELITAKEDITQALDASWQVTEQLEGKNRELEATHLQLKDAQSQMLQREKMASIGQLAAGVAHEINNPMGFITSNLGTLKKYLERIARCYRSQQQALGLDDGEAARRLIETACREQKIDTIMADLPDLIDESLDGAERVRGIVQNLKTFSRVDEAECKEVDLNDCLESTINIVWNEIKYKATLQREFGVLPPLRCFPQQLSQVFMNLLVNAAHAIEQQGEITVSSRQVGDAVVIAVRDSGSGMSDEVQARIFEPFYTTKPVGKGTGLGLSIAWEIVKKHGGSIELDSAPGRGSCFTIRLPLAGADAEEAHAEVV